MRAYRPYDTSANDKGHSKQGTECHLRQGKGIPQTYHSKFVVEIGQQAKRHGRNLRNAHEENGVKVRKARKHASPRRHSAQQMMKDEDDPVVPNVRIVRVLHLVAEEEQENPLRGRSVREHPPAVSVLGHGIGAAERVFPHVVEDDVRIGHPHPRNGEGGHEVDADVTGEDVTVPLDLEDGMNVLQSLKRISHSMLQTSQYQNDDEYSNDGGEDSRGQILLIGNAVLGVGIPVGLFGVLLGRRTEGRRRQKQRVLLLD
mmetsp:Transcript_41574/g.126031  ORF Transcript_41574/g.126031 Transcript_41574/m.126031 type:complete len:258 (-) Transcript_41574:99-872(-)